MFNKKTLIIVFGLCFLGSLFLKRFLTVNIVIDYMNSIRDQGLAIYAIFGVWVSIIYPQCLSSIKEKSKGKSVSEFNNNLIYPLVFGTVTVIVALVFRMFQPLIIANCQFFCMCKDFLKFFAALTITWCYAMQIISFLYSLIIVYDIKSEYNYTKSVAETNNSLPPDYKG